MISRILKFTLNRLKMKRIIQYFAFELENSRNNLIKKRITKVGKYVVSAGVLNIQEMERLEIGNYVLFNRNVTLMGKGELIIGDHCAIGSHVLMLTAIHNYKDPKWLPFDDGWRKAKTTIGDYVWIGNHAIIMPGINIGEGAIVGAGAVVASDVPPLGIVVGNPAFLVKERKKEDFDKAKERMKGDGLKDKMDFYLKQSSRKHFRLDDMK